ncbi:AAWKG family protein, partial [Streptomyces sp. ADMS]|uniref:AAWKG family protein n=1 Tax=Streptomyces sp. ADMS TaxID=3071415 RepID=UPI00296FE288
MAEPKDVVNNNDDNWKIAVGMLTGYDLGDRAKVFDSLKGNDGIPLMHVRLDRVGGPEYVSGFVSSGGWQRHNTDFIIPFYRSHHNPDDSDEGTLLSSYRAHITLLGTVGKAPPSGDDVIGGGERTSKVLKDKGGWNKEGEAVKWDNALLSRYVHGSVAALRQLTTFYNTHGFSHSGHAVPDDSYVDLVSFTDTAKSFDRAVKFFQESSATIEKWDNGKIGEGSQSWDGTSAAVFKELIHKLARNYEGYADQINKGDADGASETIDGQIVNSGPAQALAAAQWELYNQAQILESKWQVWKATSNPQRWLYDMLQDARWTLTNTQYNETDIQTISSGRTYRNVVVAKAGFQNTISIYGQSYGPPSDMETWKKIGAEAVRRWDQSVKDWLAAAGSDAINAIERALAAAHDAFDPKLTDKDSRSLSEISAKTEADKEKIDAKKDRDESKAEADKDREEAR